MAERLIYSHYKFKRYSNTTRIETITTYVPVNSALRSKDILIQQGLKPKRTLVHGIFWTGSKDILIQQGLKPFRSRFNRLASLFKRYSNTTRIET